MLNHDFFCCKIFLRIFSLFFIRPFWVKFSQKLTFSKSSGNCLIVKVNQNFFPNIIILEFCDQNGGIGLSRII